MRKLLLVSLLISATFFASAQITKGSTYIGGSVGVSSYKREELTATTQEGTRNYFSFNPAVGKAVKENLIAGIDLSYSRSNDKNYYNITDTTEAESIGGGIFVRRYLSIVKRFYFFTQLGVGFGITKIDNRYNNGSSYTTNSDVWGGTNKRHTWIKL